MKKLDAPFNHEKMYAMMSRDLYSTFISSGATCGTNAQNLLLFSKARRNGDTELPTLRYRNKRRIESTAVLPHFVESSPAQSTSSSPNQDKSQYYHHHTADKCSEDAYRSRCVYGRSPNPEPMIHSRRL